MRVGVLKLHKPVCYGAATHVPPAPTNQHDNGDDEHRCKADHDQPSTVPFSEAADWIRQPTPVKVQKCEIADHHQVIVGEWVQIKCLAEREQHLVKAQSHLHEKGLGIVDGHLGVLTRWHPRAHKRIELGGRGRVPP